GGGAGRARVPARRGRCPVRGRARPRPRSRAVPGPGRAPRPGGAGDARPDEPSLDLRPRRGTGPPVAPGSGGCRAAQLERAPAPDARRPGGAVPLPGCFGPPVGGDDPGGPPAPVPSRWVGRDRRVPAADFGPMSRLYRCCQALVRAGWPVVGGRLHVQGMENIPSSGPFLLIANHQSVMVPTYIQAASHNVLHTMAMRPHLPSSHLRLPLVLTHP